ncbi:MAG: HAD-IC family P-type ATPase [Eubacterium sp.]|nr:HAD-IC family P-type ATPase [Eubacterium sp.]
MTGLTALEVQERIDEGLVNEEVDTSTGTVKDIIKENVFTYFNLIFVVLAVLLGVVGSFKDLSFMLIVIANTVIGIAQEIHSKNVLDNLRFDKMPRVTVIRDGAQMEIPTEELVLGDTVILRAGNKVPADAVILDGTVQVNESLITGEQDEIEKSVRSGLFSGSYIVSGECAAELTAVGRESYINRLTAEATKTEKKGTSSPMVRALDKLVLVIGILIIPIGIILFLQQYKFMGNGLPESVTSMVAAVLGMIPEGLYMMASIALVVSAVRLAQNEVLVQNMRCIETLARVDVLCVDKTGTITENEMQVVGMDVLPEDFQEEEVNVLVSDLVQAMGTDNITMAALQKKFNNNSGRVPRSVCGFSSKYKYSGVSFSDGNFVLGAPEYVLGARFYEYEGMVLAQGSKGNRVLAFVQTEQVPDGSQIGGRIRPIALIYLANPVRESAKKTFRYFARNGVAIKVISGDNPVTVSNVALEAGIEGAETYIDARTLRDEADIERAADIYTVFGRVTPEQKRMLVRALKKKGHTVGMTGDGVNDILALRDADTSIAMASGSEAASNAAQLVLLDSDFSRMPSVVAEGRRVVNNITKTASLYLTKNIFSLLLAIFSMVSVLQYPLQPSQITLISMFTIGIPSFILSLEPNRARIKGSFLGNVFKTAAPAGITVFLSVSALLFFGQVMEIDQTAISTASSALVALVEFLILARVAKPMNKLHVGMMLVMIAGFFYAIIFHNELFGISPMNGKTWLLLIVFLIATEALFKACYEIAAVLGLVATKEGRAKTKAAWQARQARIKAERKAAKEEDELAEIPEEALIDIDELMDDAS